MKRSAATAIAIVALVGIWVGGAVASEAPGEPIQVTNYGEKAPVTFDHAQHTGDGWECVSCHHNEAEGKYRCGECHRLEADGDTPKIKDAMHKKEAGVCYACHLNKAAEHKRKCNDCHRE